MEKIEPKRARALNLAYKASRLLDEAYYDDFSKAVNTKDKELFIATCDKARIPPDLRELLWESARATSPLKPTAGW